VETRSGQEALGKTGEAPAREATKQTEEGTTRQDGEEQRAPNVAPEPAKTAEERPKAPNADQSVNSDEKRATEQKTE
ncbi:hypothetical protein OFC46_28275, partial [Escherichia coli]|nr:hypothetical protein [Escherichia coli]